MCVGGQGGLRTLVNSPRMDEQVLGKELVCMW